MEGVGGQIDGTGASVCEQGRPVDLDAAHPQLGRARQEPLQPTLVTPQRTSNHDTLGAIGDLLHGRGQHRMGGDLHERAEALRGQLLHRLGEPHPGTQIREPIAAIHCRAIGELPRHRRQHRHPTRTWPDALQSSSQIVLQRVHGRGVRGIIHRDPASPHPQPLTLGHHLTDRLRLTGDHHLRGTVDRSHPHPTRPPRQQLLNPLHRRSHRRHTTRTGQPSDRLTAQAHHSCGVLQRQRPRHTRRSDLTLRMPHHSRRLHPVRPPQRRQRHHHHERGRLEHIDPLPQRRIGLAPQYGGDRPVDQAAHHRLALGHHRGEHRRALQQTGTHTQPLRTLTREDEHRPPHRPRDTRHHATSRLTRGQRRQPRPERAEHRSTVLEPRPRRHQRPAHINRIDRINRTKQRSGLIAQRLPVTCGQQPRHHRRNLGRPGSSADADHGLLRSLFEDHVRVRPTHPERRHTSTPRPVIGTRPLTCLGQQLHRARRPVHVRRRRLGVQCPGQQPVPQRQHHLHHARDTGRTLRVPDVRLDRPQPQRLLGRTVLAVGGQQCLRLDRVAQLGAGAVRLHHVHVRGRDPGVRQRLPDDPLLGRAVRRRQTVRRTVLVHRPAAQHRQHLVPVATRIRQTLQEKDARAFGDAHAVRVVRERLGAAVLGETALTAETDEAQGRRADGGSAGEGQRAFAGPQ